MVSLPTANSFVHVAHVGLNEEGTMAASRGVDPSWTAVLVSHGLQDHNTQFTEPQQMDISERFRKGVEAINNVECNNVNASHNREHFL